MNTSKKIKAEMGLVKKPRDTLSDLNKQISVSKRKARVLIQELLCTSESEIRSVMSDSVRPHGIPRHEYWSRKPFPSPTMY